MKRPVGPVERHEALEEARGVEGGVVDPFDGVLHRLRIEGLVVVEQDAPPELELLELDVRGQLRTELRRIDQLADPVPQIAVLLVGLFARFGMFCLLGGGPDLPLFCAGGRQGLQRRQRAGADAATHRGGRAPLRHRSKRDSAGVESAARIRCGRLPRRTRCRARAR